MNKIVGIMAMALVAGGLFAAGLGIGTSNGRSTASSRHGTASNGCDVDSTKLKFLSTCEAYERQQDRGSLNEPDPKANHRLCRCAALGFAVENVPDEESTCSFSFERVGGIMTSDKVQLGCR
jgi:hypothetical protein